VKHYRGRLCRQQNLSPLTSLTGSIAALIIDSEFYARTCLGTTQFTAIAWGYRLVHASSCLVTTCRLRYIIYRPFGERLQSRAIATRSVLVI
jgi:hypothetical protein